MGKQDKSRRIREQPDDKEQGLAKVHSLFPERKEKSNITNERPAGIPKECGVCKDPLKHQYGWVGTGAAVVCSKKCNTLYYATDASKRGAYLIGKAPFPPVEQDK